jgi:diaminopropionate ammonia-lyase
MTTSNDLRQGESFFLVYTLCCHDRVNHCPFTTFVADKQRWGTYTIRYFLNPTARSTPQTGLFEPVEYQQVLEFFRSEPRLQPTPLHRLPHLAAALGIGELLVKDESSRLGVNSFKIVGVSYAMARLLMEGTFKKHSAVACATDGNHGRAVARLARMFGLEAHIFVHHGTVSARTKAISDEGAHVVLVDGNYDDSVREATEKAELNGWLIVSDTSWPGYEVIPRNIMAGYTKILDEASAQWGHCAPDIVLVQAGVGGLLCAVASWFCYRYGKLRPYVISCEPKEAACALESACAGEPVTIPGRLGTIMAGLSAGRLSSIAYPVIAGTVDAFVAIEDEWSERAMRCLARPQGDDLSVVAGESGACGLAALLAILEDKKLAPVKHSSSLSSASRVMIINTEGATDPVNYTRIVGQPTNAAKSD